MPPFRSCVSLVTVLVGTMVAGCTSTGMGLEELSADAGFSYAAGDPMLPESIEVLPSFSSEPEAVLAEAAGDGASGILAVAAYADPSPADTAAGLVSAGRRVEPRSAELDALIARYARIHEIPEDLLRRVVNRESTFNPAARNGPYWGLMQILPATARTMGYKGAPEGLLDAETNLIYAGKYLRGAYLTADGDHDLAVRYYSRGYYYDAKRKGLLEETGLRSTRTRMARSS